MNEISMYDPPQRPPAGSIVQPGGSTLQRAPAAYPPYYYTDRAAYGTSGYYDKGPVTVTVERGRRKFGPCMWILAILAVLLILALVICLIIFFTWGSGYRANERVYDRPNYLLPLEQPEFVLNSLESKDRQLCILDTAFLTPNYVQLYNEEHIPTARHFDINKVRKTPGVGDGSATAPLVSILEFQSYVRSLGVNKDCHVILYDHGETNVSITTATYVWFLFRLHQYNRVTIINGGLRGWRELTKKEPQYQATNIVSKNTKEGDFQAGWNPDLWLSFDDLKASLAKRDAPQLFDARNPDYYTGKLKHKDAKEGGRIKGALNAPVEEVIKPDTGGFKILPQVKQWMEEKKLTLDRPTVIYCNIGMSSSALYFLVTQTGTRQDVKLYHNGWVEWSFKAPEELKEHD